MIDWLAISGRVALAVAVVAGIGYLALMAVAASRCCAPEATARPAARRDFCLGCVCALAPGPGCEGCGLNDPEFGCLGGEPVSCRRVRCEQARAEVRRGR